MQALVFLVGFLLLSRGVPLDIRDIAADFHARCLSVLNRQNGEWEPVYKALVCGQRLRGGPVRRIFEEAGLIHLMTVSGAHLLFMERLWIKLPLPFLKKTWIFLFLIFYALITDLHPPVVRALFAFFLFQLSHSYKLCWSHPLVTHLSGALCLFYSPHWIHSVSLQLSWLASLAYGISSFALMRALTIYIIVLPVVSQWSFLHPLTAFVNWSLAPLVGALLLPLSFAAAVLPFLLPLSDAAFSALFLLLKEIVRLLPDLPRLKSFRVFVDDFIWIYIGAVFILSCLASVWSRRTGKKI